MAIRSNIVVKDGAATPADVIFKPAPSGDPLVVQYFNDTPGVIAGFNRLSIRTRLASASAGQKITISVVHPTLSVVSPSTATGVQPLQPVAYNTVAELSFVLPRGSTKEERQWILAVAKNLAAHAVVQAAVVDLDSPY